MPDPDILLLGAGHANLLAVAPLRRDLPQARITLIDAARHAIYSGMFPGHVAGLHAAGDLCVDLTGFAARHGIRFQQARVTGIDPLARQAVLNDGTRLGYGLAALDLGSHTAMPEIAGFARHAVAIKPLDGFAARLDAIPATAPVAIIGGGVAGAEMALALARRLSGRVTLIEAGDAIAQTLGPRAQAALHKALTRAGVRMLTGAQVVQVGARSVMLRDGQSVASALTIGIAGARAQDWLARDLPVDQAGFVRITPTLLVEGQTTLFAAGDCAAMIHAPRPKAGVFAVRQAPVLTRNLIAAHRGQPLGRFDPQRETLKIISLGDGSGLAQWRGLAVQGRWLLRWKDRIDRRFMRRLQG